jgi:biofilm protein TabA
MIYGNLKDNGDISIYSQAIQKAIKYLNENDMESVAPGKYEIDGDKMFVQVMDTQTSSRSERKPEVHRQYVDVQFLAKGEEQIAFYSDMQDNETDEEFLETRDIIFYKNNEKARESLIKMEPGSFAIFFPWDVHVPAIAVNEPMIIRKVVIKVKVSEL